MRICFISRRFFPAISGMSIYAGNLLRELVGAGHDVTMISQYYGGSHATVYGGGPPPAVRGVRVIGLEALGEQAGGDFERDVETMRRTILAEHKRQPFDILHAQYAYPNGWAALLASREIGVPTIVSIQGGDGHWVGSCCQTHRRAMQHTLDNAGALLIGGASFAQEVASRLGTRRDRFTIVPGAVNTLRFTPRTQAREDGPIRLLYHGRVDRRKGVLDFIEALARLGGPRTWQASISGIGPDLQAAQSRATACGFAEDAIRFTGYAHYHAAPLIYAAHDIFVSPTYSEGFSNTILEAMASGLPILSCHAVGVTDCLRDNENALLVDPGDIDAQGEALANLLANAPLRDRLAATALGECRALYGWGEVGRRIMGVYAQVAGSRPITSFNPDLPMTPCRFRDNPALL